jgi:hypothetical protein
MSIQPPQGILTIPNATLRVGRLQVDEVEGFDTVLNTFDKNTILEEDSEVYDDDKKWGVKMPNIFVATFEIKGAGSSFNFRNTSMGDAGVGYTLTFSGTTLTLKYDDSDPVLATATIPNLDFTYGKVYLTYEKQYFTVTVDGTRVLSYKDTGTRTFPDGEYINFFAGGDGGFKNLKVVAGHLISDGTSNVSLYGGLAVTSNLEVGSSNLFVDTVNSRVGVGTTTPEATLHVSGNAYVSSNLEVGSSNLFVDTVNSRVGVGTTTPEATLHVSGNAYVSSNLEVGSSNLFVDTVNSRVGVGTDTPKESLDVVGNMHLTRVSNVSQIKVDSNVVTEYTGPHDRPLRKYPEVALTTDDNLSTSGYKASVSSLLTGSDAFRAFDATGATSYWHSQYPYYTHATGTYNPGQSSGGVGTPSGTLPTTELISGHQGEWIKLQMPTRIKLEEVRVYASNRASTNIYQMPKDIAIAGSNDGTNWYLVDSGTLRTGIRESYGMASLPVTTSSYYSYLALIVKTIDNQGANYSAVEIANIEYYGYEEGIGSLDTTLKSVYNVPATTGTQLEVYYDGRETSSYSGSGTTVNDISPNTNNGTLNGGVGFDSTYKAFTFDGVDDYIDGTITTGIDAWSHTVAFWVKIDEFNGAPFFIIDPSADGADPAASTAPHLFANTNGTLNYAFWSNAGNFLDDNGNQLIAQKGVWQHYVVQYDASTGGTNYTDRKLIINGNQTYYPAAGTATALNMSASNNLHIGGRFNSSVSIFFNGSIANFRLYSKVLNADQVKELYDYQKDYFLGSKSQVTLYKGHLGVGVTEPSGQLELAGDERIQSIPPRGLERTPREVYDGMTADEFVEGHGVFNVSASGGQLPDYNGAQLVFRRQSPFTAVAGDLNYWSRAGVYNSSGIHTGTAKTAISGGGTLNGEWIQLSSPYGYYLKKTVLYHRYSSSTPTWERARMPKDFTFVGSNNGSSWSVIKSFGNISYEALKGKDLEIDSKIVYKDVRLIVHSIVAVNPDGVSGNETTLDIGQWHLFGTPGPTTLDKGSLSLGRSLDVPRVSRYDVDTETPRPEKLVVDFDTTVNSSPTDISGKGNHGVMLSGASYSTADKAFDFNATSGTADTNGPSGSDNWGSIETTVPQLNGAQEITFSGWFKLDAIGVFQILYLLGRVTRTQDNNHMHWFAVSENGTLRAVVSGGAHINVYYTNTVLVANRWYHISYSIPSGTTVARNDVKVYLDGVEQVSTSSTGSASAIDIGDTGDAKLYLGWQEGSTNYFAGRVSNFKIYNAFLEPSEVKKLYNLGRTGRSMVISDTAIGIGKVPEAQLDVRGTANFGSRVGIGTTNPETTLQLHKELGADTLKSAAEIKFSTNNSSNTLWDVGSIRGAVSLNAGGSSSYPGGLVFATKSPGSASNDLTDKVVIDADGRFGIGTTNPGAVLDVRSGTEIPRLRGDAGRSLFMGSNYTYVNSDGFSETSGTYAWDGYPGVVRMNSGGEWRLHGESGTYTVLVRADGGFATFTGSHDTFTPFSEDDVGKIVYSTGNYATEVKDGNVNGVIYDYLTIMDSCPVVKMCATENDKRVMGVLSTRQRRTQIKEISKEEYELITGDEKYAYEKKEGTDVYIRDIDTDEFSRGYYNAVGEGGIWVCNKNGNLENGDYITSSTVAGYGQKQNDDLLHNYTVAKITTDCDFTEIWVTTKKHKKTGEGYLFDENNEPVYENILDTEGNTQNHLKFKLRYLLPDGTQISEEEYTTKTLADEKVYVAAFVGCTYHCG